MRGVRWLLVLLSFAVMPEARPQIILCFLLEDAAPSYVLNAQVIDVTYSVNSGPEAQLAGTGATSRWQPTQSLIHFDPLCGGRGSLRWGQNSLALRPTEGASPTATFRFTIGDGVNVQTQFQLYVLWNGDTNFRLLVLSDGLFLTLADPS